MNKNISDIHNCFGCGICAVSCAHKLITIQLNSRGFYEPQIKNLNQCVHCSVCVDVCAFLHDDFIQDNARILSWASWSNNPKIRSKCSSGGIGFEIGRQLIRKGYKAVGCRYNVEKHRAEHFIATTEEEYSQSIGSKYLQSYTFDAFSNIRRREDRYLITGTPCQIDSFRRMIRKYKCENNFILMDFFCHCVPSYYAWEAYLKIVEKQIGKILHASWRNKCSYGWHDSWTMGLDGERNSIHSRLSEGDLFYKFFLGDVCLGLQCEKNCRYKYDKSSADIRIGDLWGNTYKDEEKGVSALIAFTEKGKDVILNLSDVTLIRHSFDIVAEGQMKQNAKRKIYAPFIFWLLRRNSQYQFIYTITFTICKFIDKITLLFRRII